MSDDEHNSDTKSDDKSLWMEGDTDTILKGMKHKENHVNEEHE